MRVSGETHTKHCLVSKKVFASLQAPASGTWLDLNWEFKGFKSKTFSFGVQFAIDFSCLGSGDSKKKKKREKKEKIKIFPNTKES